MSKSNSPITWAQRHDRLLLTIDVADLDPTSLKVEIQEQSLNISAKNKEKQVDTQLKLYGKVKAEDAKYAVHGKSAELIIYRAEPGEYWPKLVSDSAKFPWLRVDWGKWKDEDAEDDEDDRSKMMQNLPDFGSGFGGGFGNQFGGMPDFGAEGDDDDEDDDDEPALEETGQAHGHTHEGHEHHHHHDHDHAHEGHEHHHHHDHDHAHEGHEHHHDHDHAHDHTHDHPRE